MPAPGAWARSAEALTICAQPRVRVLAGHGPARVVESEAPTPYSSGLREVWGCWGRHRLAMGLGQSSYGPNDVSAGPVGSVGPFAFVGDLLAYDHDRTFDEQGENPEDRVSIVDLRTRTVLASARDGIAPAQPGIFSKPTSVSIGPVTSIVLSPDGAAAWIAESPNAAGELPVSAEVLALDRSGPRLLADSATIALKSLRLSGSTVSWQQDGQPASAAL